MNKQTKCPDCGKAAKDRAGCARVVCPERRQVTAHATDWTDHSAIAVSGGYVKVPTTRDEE